MPTYRALKKGWDGKRLREKGDTFEFEGKPGSWMEEVKGKPGRPPKAKAEAEPSEPKATGSKSVI